MSSDQEENADHIDEPSTSSSATEGNQSFEKKNNGPNEHAKPRRRRRGKKRKHKKESAATCETENPDVSGELHVENDHVEWDSFTWDSDENLSSDVYAFNDVIIRPINVPRAPENSTQFIMDDHNDCRHYVSFETPNPYSKDLLHHLDSCDKGEIIEPIGEDAAYRDIDYQYESPQDFDNSAYYDREFELSYKNNRFDELMRLSRPELISALQTLETRSKELSEQLVKENPSPILEKLQAELLELQEKHSYLKDTNSKLTAELYETVTSDCSETEITSEALPVASHERHSESEEVYHDASETVEDVAMSVVDPNLKTPEKTCDKNSVDSGGKVYHQYHYEKSNENSMYPIGDSNGEEQPKLSLNSRLRHCHAHSIDRDDLRTLTINNNSDLFHAKCSSAVPHEGGMSPSETSVN